MYEKMIYYHAVTKRGILKNKSHKIQNAHKIWNRFPSLLFYYSEPKNIYVLGSIENLFLFFPKEKEDIKEKGIGINTEEEILEEAQYQEELREYTEARNNIHSFFAKRVKTSTITFSPSKYGGTNDTNHTQASTVKRMRPLGSPTYDKR